ncbi:MAG: hypothetical protein ACTSP4_08680 [Candidatus Hodarchaeales archaeon]
MVQVYSLEQLRTLVEDSTSAFREKLATGEIDHVEISKFISSLLTERRLLLDTVDDLKNAQMTLKNSIFHQKDLTTLVINEMNGSLYNDFCIASYKLGITSGKALTLLMKEVLRVNKDDFPVITAKILVAGETEVVRISDHRFLKVYSKDLIETDAPVSFDHIEYLDLEKVDSHVFLKYIRLISNCAYIRLSSSIPKLLVYTKSNKCGFFEFTKDQE